MLSVALANSSPNRKEAELLGLYRRLRRFA